MKTAKEYHGRILRLKPIIEADEGLMQRIAQTFDILYNQPPPHRIAGGRKLPEGIDELGRGKRHEVFSVGKVVDPLQGREVYLAVRLCHRVPYQTQLGKFLAEQMGAFEDAFTNGKISSPYVVGVITSPLTLINKLLSGSRVAGMLLEDITEGKKYSLFEERYDHEHVFRSNGSGKEGPFLIDPEYDNRDTERFMEFGKKYLSDEARIDLKI